MTSGNGVGVDVRVLLASKKSARYVEKTSRGLEDVRQRVNVAQYEHLTSPTKETELELEDALQELEIWMHGIKRGYL